MFNFLSFVIYIYTCYLLGCLYHLACFIAYAQGGVERFHCTGTMARSSFKQEHDLEKRKVEAARIRDKYPDRIPVNVEKAERSDIPNIDKKKYLVGQFVYVIQKWIISVGNNATSDSVLCSLHVPPEYCM